MTCGYLKKIHIFVFIFTYIHICVFIFIKRLCVYTQYGVGRSYILSCFLTRSWNLSESFSESDHRNFEAFERLQKHRSFGVGLMKDVAVGYGITQDN